jgi:hypothetical protein
MLGTLADAAGSGGEAAVAGETTATTAIGTISATLLNTYRSFMESLPVVDGDHSHPPTNQLSRLRVLPSRPQGRTLIDKFEQLLHRRLAHLILPTTTHC